MVTYKQTSLINFWTSIFKINLKNTFKIKSRLDKSYKNHFKQRSVIYYLSTLTNIKILN